MIRSGDTRLCYTFITSNKTAMELKGRCKEEFEKWWEMKPREERGIWYKGSIDTINFAFGMEHFYRCSPSMQFGVLVDFFEENDIYPVILPHWKKGIKSFRVGFHVVNGGVIDSFFIRPNNEEVLFVEFKTPHEAREAALEKAQELFNSK